MKKFSPRASAVVLALGVAFSSPAFTQTPAAGQDSNEVQPRFIWGALVKILGSSVFSSFGDWLSSRLTGGVSGAIPQNGFAPMQANSFQPGMPGQVQGVPGQTGVTGQLVQGAMIGALDAFANVVMGRPQQQGMPGAMPAGYPVPGQQGFAGQQPAYGSQPAYGAPPAFGAQPAYPGAPGAPQFPQPQDESAYSQQGGQGYPQGAAYPQGGAQYPQAGQQFPQASPQYPQSATPYPQQNPQYPQGGSQYPQGMAQQQQYPQAGSQFAQPAPQYPQGGAQFPQQGAASQYPQGGQPFPQGTPQYSQGASQYPQGNPAYPQAGQQQSPYPQPGYPQASAYPQQAGMPQGYPQQQSGMPQGYPQQAAAPSSSGFPPAGYPQQQAAYPQAQAQPYPGQPAGFAQQQPGAYPQPQANLQPAYPPQGYPQPAAYPQQQVGYPQAPAYYARGALSADGPKITEQFVAARDVVLGRPTKPLEVQGKDPNYEGVHVAIVALDSTGKPTSVRSVSDGFKTGEKFKLRVVSTFEGLVAIDNINPKGEQKRIYPDGNNVVAIPLGQEVLLPLAADEWFELAGNTGKEQLVVTVRDRRAFGEAAANNRVFRQDEKYGSNFVQEVAPGKTFPVITQSITFSHTQ